MHAIRGYEESLQGVILEGLSAKFNVLVADIRKDCRLRVHFVVLTRFGYDTSLNVAEEATTQMIYLKSYTTLMIP